MHHEISPILQRFETLHVLVIGDAILDIYTDAVAEKLSREAPAMVLNVLEHRLQCGGAANTALNIASMGATCHFVTVTGKDSGGRDISSILEGKGVDVSAVVRDRERKTVCKRRVLAGNNIVVRMDEGTTLSLGLKSEVALLAQVKRLYDEVDILILSDYEGGVLTANVIDGIQLLNHANKPVIVDARSAGKFRKLKPYAIKPNYEEMIALLNIPATQGEARVEQIIAQQERLLELTGATVVAATIDCNGAVILRKNEEPYHILCEPREHHQAIGAGDSFTSAFSLGVAAGATVEVAAELGAAAAAIVLDKQGTAGCSRFELQAYFKPLPKLIGDVGELQRLVCDLKERKLKVVFTNGCFDILHKGHIYLLREARKLGDVLVVGLNSDASIRRIKGEGRPLNRLDDRIEVLSGLSSVDYIIPFEEETPEALIRELHPDIFVKGGNYTAASVPEIELLRGLGCELQILPLVQDYSTSTIIQRIRQHETSHP